MRTITKLMTAMFITGIVALLASPAVADESVTVEVRAISASTDGEQIDSELADIRGRLERGFPDYTSFRYLGSQSRRIRRDNSRNFEIPTGDTLVLSYNGRAGEFVKLGLTLGSRLNTTLRATPGSTFFQAGLRFEGNILILAISVE